MVYYCFTHIVLYYIILYYFHTIHESIPGRRLYCHDIFLVPTISIDSTQFRRHVLQRCPVGDAAAVELAMDGFGEELGAVGVEQRGAASWSCWWQTTLWSFVP